MKNLINSILGSASRPHQWGKTLDECNAILDVTASAMFSIHEFEALRTNFAWSSFWKANCDTAEVEQFLRENDADDQPAYANLFRMKPQRLYPEVETFGVQTQAELPYSTIRNLTKGFGIVDRVAAQLNSTGPWIDGLFLHPTSLAQSNGLRDNPKIDIILPLMAGSLSLNRQLTALRSRYQASLSVLDALGIGVFLIDVSGCVVEHNAEAQRIFDQQDGVVLTSAKRLWLSNAETTAQLEHAVAITNGLLHGEITQPASIFSATRPSGKYEYLISINALSDLDGELESGLRCAFVTIIDPARSKVLSADGLEVLGNLSSAERCVVDLLIEGHRPSEVADQRDVSINTIKTQMKTIAQKLRCSSQSDIIRIAAATRIPIKK